MSRYDTLRIDEQRVCDQAQEALADLFNLRVLPYLDRLLGKHAQQACDAAHDAIVDEYVAEALADYQERTRRE